MGEENKIQENIEDISFFSDTKLEKYWFWQGLWKSKSSLKEITQTAKDSKRQRKYLNGQIVLHFLKNFFLFPFWLLRLLVPSYMKGDNNVFTNLKSIITKKEFQPLRIALISQFVFILILGMLGYFIFYKHSIKSLAVDYTWIQSDWSTGADTNTTANHDNNETNWDKYYSASTTLDASSAITLGLQTLSVIETNDVEFNTGTNSTTTVSNNSVILSEVLVASSTFFTATGTVVWVVPDGNDSINVDVIGSQGTAHTSYYVDQGGKGGRVQATYPVFSGQTLYVYVGGRSANNSSIGGYNGGGNGGGNGAGGGGASDIRIGGTALTDRIFVGAGGGGGSYDSGLAGYGGYPDGMIGDCLVGDAGGGTQSSGGAGGPGVNGGPAAGSGSLGQGGYGGSRGGGGGGGYYGGGGCNYGGGAGGSSYADPNATNVIYTSNYKTGSGQVGITYFAPSPTPIYYTSGTFVSQITDLNVNSNLTTLDYTTTLNGQTITLDVRAGDSEAVDGTWTEWLTDVSNGGDISSLGTHRYIQYRANLSTSDTAVTPTLDDVTINYSQYPTSGTLVSSPFDSGEANIILNNLSWVEDLPTNTDIQLQLRTSADNSTWTSWMGPDGTSDTYFTDNTGGETLPESITDATDDEWIQYQVILTSDGVSTPNLSSITLAMNPPAPPGAPVIGDFTNITTSTITLNWDTVTDTVYYIINSSVTGEEIVTTTETNYTFNTNLEPNTRYYYEVVARDQYDQDSATSTQRSKYTNPNIPLNISATANGQTSANLTWSANSNPTTTVYKIYRVDGDNVSSLAGSTTSTSYTVTGLTSGTSYSFTVRAIYNSDNTSYEESEVSNSITTEIPKQTVTIILRANDAAPSFTFQGQKEEHTVQVSRIVDHGNGDYKATIVLHSNTVNVTLGSGESQNVDLSGNGSNDTTVTMIGVTSNSANFTLSAIPQGGSGVITNPPTITEIIDNELSNKEQGISTTTEKLKAVVINNGDKITNKKQVNLKFNITGATQMAISNDAEFTDVSFQAYQKQITNWELTEGNGTKIIYVRFRSKEGGTITYSATITLTEQNTDDPKAINLEILKEECSLETTKPYRTKNNATVYYITEDCTKRAFRNPATYFSYFTSWNEVNFVTDKELDVIPLDNINTMILNKDKKLLDNSLVKTLNNPVVYLIKNQEKHRIPDETTFHKYNYNWSDILFVEESLLIEYIDGYILE